MPEPFAGLLTPLIRYNPAIMIAESKITRQRQVTVPAEIRRRLGLAAGSTIEWCERDGEIVVRKAAKFTSDQIHRVLFEQPPEETPLERFDEGIADRMRRRHAGD